MDGFYFPPSKASTFSVELSGAGRRMPVGSQTVHFHSSKQPPAEPVALGSTGWLAPVEHWLRVLPTVRVCPGSRGRVRSVDVPVADARRVRDGAEIDLDLDELRRGTWVGERTLRLHNGWEAVFTSPRR